MNIDTRRNLPTVWATPSSVYSKTLRKTKAHGFPDRGDGVKQVASWCGQYYRTISDTDRALSHQFIATDKCANCVRAQNPIVKIQL